MKLQIVVSYHNSRWQARPRILTCPEAKKRRVDFKAQNRQFLEWDTCDAPEILINHTRQYNLNGQVIIMNSKKKRNYIISGIILNAVYQKYKENIPYLVKVCHSFNGVIFNEDNGALHAVLENIITLNTAKSEAHIAFDEIWKKGHMKRGEAYTWLSWKMKTHRTFCHISLFDWRQCQDVIRYCKEYFAQHIEA